jgi:hypothetical protein
MHGVLRICVAATVISFGSVVPSLSQPILTPPETARELVQEAFGSPFGRALIAEFNALMREGADPACLRARRRH